MTSKQTVQERAIDTCIEMLDYAQVNVSNHKVGSAVVARDKENNIGIFGGCNIELACAYGYHAEQVALTKAISHGFTNIDSVYVTSTHEEQLAAMCGLCRQTFMYVNPNCMVYVINLDKSIKLKVKLIDTLNYPYIGGRFHK